MASDTTKSAKNPMEELLASLAGKSLALERGQEVEGTVVSKTDREIIVDLGTKSEGVIPAQDVPPETKVGDKVSAFVVQPENDSGQVVLSLQSGQKPQPASSRWNKIIKADQNKTTLTGQVVSINSGGLVVEIDGIQGFLPTSQISNDNITKDIGSEVQVEVLEVNPAQNRLIFTQKAGSEAWANLAEKYSPEQIVKGEVTKVTQFGIFVKLEEGVEGLIHISRLGPDDNFKAGEQISVIVTDIDSDKKRISLSPVITSTKDLIYK